MIADKFIYMLFYGCCLGQILQVVFILSNAYTPKLLNDMSKDVYHLNIRSQNSSKKSSFLKVRILDTTMLLRLVMPGGLNQKIALALFSPNERYYVNFEFV